MIAKVVGAILLSALLVLVDSKSNAARSKYEPITAANVQRLQVLTEFDYPYIRDIAWSADGELLAVGLKESVNIFSSEDNFSTPTVLDDVEQTYRLAFLPQMNALLVVNCFYSLSSLSEIDCLPFEYDTITVSRDGTRIAYTFQNTLHVLDVESGTELYSKVIYAGENCEDYGCAAILEFSSDATQLVYASVVYKSGRGIVDLESGEVILIPYIGLFSLTFDPASDLVASYGGLPGYVPSEFVGVWSTQTGMQVDGLDVYGSGLAFNHDGSLLATSIYDDNAPNPDEADKVLSLYEVIYESDSKRVSLNLVHSAYLGYAHSIGVAFNSQGTFLATVDEERLKIWGILAD
jgi:WD40 repeat protein